MAENAQAAWHQALVYAVTGQRLPELGRQAEPDLEAVVALVGAVPPEHHVVPPELLEEIGPAHFFTVLAELRGRLRGRTSHPVLAERALSADERRLVADAPPHHH